MRVRTFLIAGIAATTLSLAGCKRSEAPPPVENAAMVEPEPTMPPEPPQPAIAELPKAEAPTKPKPAPEVSADQQVLDDADATGMTARVTRDGDAGDSQPASGGGNEQE